MRQLIAFIIILLCALCVLAQAETSDSIPAQELREIVIEAPKVIRKADMDVYHPSKSAVENSKNGMQLLNNLMIPSLSVSDALSSITAAGQSVQVRINGRTATIDQVRALLPETIKRVEWMDNPGLRYGGANYVLNFIVANPTLGGSMQLYARPALNAAWGFYMADAKFNDGKSQFEIGTNYKLTNKIKTHRDYTETFTYPDGYTLTRKETSRGGSMDNTMGNLWASYNYIKPDTTVFVAEFSMHKDFTDKFLYNGLLSLSDGTDDILLTDSHGDKGTTPSLSLYLQQHFAHKQMLVVDFSSSFYFGRTFSDYVEQLPSASSYFKESDRGNHTWSARPQATITYSPNQNHNFRLNFTSWQSTPSLAETNVVPQQLDGFQWRVGNQNLKTANSYMLTFRYGFNLPRVTGSFGIRAFTSPNAITPLLEWNDDRLITTYENGRGLKNLSFFLSPQIEIIPEWLTVSGYVQYRMERMKGTGYAINHNGWSGNASLQLAHWGFVFGAEYRYAQRDLWGEKISWGEDINVFTLDYNWNDWQFGAGIIMPFGKYDQGSRSLSKWNRNEQHMRLDMCMPFVTVSWNLQWGRQKRGVQKIINADANTDRSTAGGR